jgi:LCP family protein required for cell wall assembly
MADKPEYRVYRARRGLLSRLLNRDRSRFEPPAEAPPTAPPRTAAGRTPPAGGAPSPPASLDRPADRLRPEPAEPVERPGLLRPAPPAERPRRITPRRVLVALAIAIVGWALLSFVLFMISAHVQSGKVPDRVKAALDDGGNMLTSANNILVLGSDRRPGEHGPSRADTIMLMRYGGGKAARLSIPRDTLAPIPGHGSTKINAAYAFGGTRLMIETVKQFLGIEVNHVVEVDFRHFPKFVDALGGVKMRFDGCIVSHFEGRNPHYGCKGKFRRCRASHEKQHLNGKQALDVVRIRKNICAPAESDLTRARRQQKFLEAVKGRIFSPWAFPRWPWAAWEAPRAIKSDMAGPTLLALFFDSEVSGSLKPTILEPINPGANPLEVSPAEKQDAVRKFLDG